MDSSDGPFKADSNSFTFTRPVLAFRQIRSGPPLPSKSAAATTCQPEVPEPLSSVAQPIMVVPEKYLAPEQFRGYQHLKPQRAQYRG
jgi:hypothetical protein